MGCLESSHDESEGSGREEEKKEKGCCPVSFKTLEPSSPKDPTEQPPKPGHS